MNKTRIIFKAHPAFITTYYALLMVWTLVSVLLLIAKSSNISTLWLAMIVFIIVITWYWSLGLVYSIALEDSHTVRCKSFRKNMTFKVDDVRRIVAPPSRIQFGFLRVCLPRETLYTFFSSSEPLQKILTAIKTHSPTTQFAKFSPYYFKESHT